VISKISCFPADVNVERPLQTNVFFINLKSLENLSVNMQFAFLVPLVLTHAIQHRKPSPIPTTEEHRPASPARGRPENATRHRICAKKNNANRNQRPQSVARSSKKDTLQTHPAKKRNENNLVGQARNDVSNRHFLCRYFVIFPRARLSQTFVTHLCSLGTFPAKGVQLLPYLAHPSRGAR
jgi:hypothetical protein